MLSPIRDAIGLAAGGFASDFVTAIAMRRLPATLTARLPRWAMQLGVSLLGAVVLRKLGMGRFARPFALGGSVVALNNATYALNFSGVSIAQRTGLADYATLGEAQYGMLGYGDAELLGLGDYAMSSDYPQAPMGWGL